MCLPRRLAGQPRLEGWTRDADVDYIKAGVQGEYYYENFYNFMHNPGNYQGWGVSGGIGPAFGFSGGWGRTLRHWDNNIDDMLDSIPFWPFDPFGE